LLAHYPERKTKAEEELFVLKFRGRRSGGLIGPKVRVQTGRFRPFSDRYLQKTKIMLYAVIFMISKVTHFQVNLWVRFISLLIHGYRTLLQNFAKPRTNLPRHLARRRASVMNVILLVDKVS
jgi:hypothetical protein